MEKLNNPMFKGIITATTRPHSHKDFEHYGHQMFKYKFYAHIRKKDQSKDYI